MVRQLHQDWHEELDRDGFTLITKVFTDPEVRPVIAQLTSALADAPRGAISSRRNRVYASRNLLQLFPQAAILWDREPLRTVLRETLGDFGRQLWSRAGVVL